MPKPYSKTVVCLMIGGVFTVLIVYATKGLTPPPGMLSLAAAVISGAGGFHLGSASNTPPTPIVIPAPAPTPAATAAPPATVPGATDPPAPPGAGTTPVQE